jgi:hypothetical protein
MQIEKHKLKQRRKLLLRLLLLPLRRGLKQLRMHHLLRMFKPMIDHKQLGLVILLVVAKVQLDLIAHHHHHQQFNENHPAGRPGWRRRPKISGRKAAGRSGRKRKLTIRTEGNRTAHQRRKPENAGRESRKIGRRRKPEIGWKVAEKRRPRRKSKILSTVAPEMRPRGVESWVRRQGRKVDRRRKPKINRRAAPKGSSRRRIEGRVQRPS